MRRRIAPDESAPATITSAVVSALDVDLKASDTGPHPATGSITILTPPDGIETGEDAVLVSGKAEMANLFTVTVNGAQATVTPEGNFTAAVKLVECANEITVRATDKDQNAIEAKVHVIYTPAAPPI